MTITSRVTCILLLVLTTACASFPEAEPGIVFDDGLSAADWTQRLLSAHGGDLSDDPRDFNLAMTGHWYSLIQRIQPLVSDAEYRVSAEERYRPADQLYVVRHRGPAGIKTIWRQSDEIRVWYDGREVQDEDVLAASAMTTDAFELFHFGPSFLVRRAAQQIRLKNAKEDGRRYPRLLFTIEPGFGRAESDQVVAWINPDTHRLHRVHLTLNGFETTQGAHVDTTFFDYVEQAGYWFPTRFEERVRGPIRIDAHDWQITARDHSRGWTPEDVEGPEFEGRAAAH